VNPDVRPSHFDAQHLGIQIHTGPATGERVRTTPTRVIFTLTIDTAHAGEFANGKEAVDRTVEFVGIWHMR